MRWTARVGERVHEVELTRADGGVVTASVDGRAYRLSFTEPQPSVYSILSEDGSSHEAIVRVEPGRCRVRLGSRVFEVLAVEPPHETVGARARDASGQVFVRALMPGRVLRVMVEPGRKVAARQGLVVVEAMKMENEVSAPRDGIVEQVKVEPGRTIEAGDLLVVIR